ncbi:movement protein (p12) [Japanese iris necrotic ring virus]|nr:movement protein (p12) [Japanese iris necrotic ring virus]BAA92795.1 movement protein (p12) [Japanese iris necrotic ring virus]
MPGAVKRLRGLLRGMLRCLQFALWLVGKLLVGFGCRSARPSPQPTIFTSEPLWDNDLLLVLIISLTFTLIYIFAQQQPVHHHHYSESNHKTQHITIGTESQTRQIPNGAT